MEVAVAAHRKQTCPLKPNQRASELLWMPRVISTSSPFSDRFREAVKFMDKASKAILGLKPVTFRYREEVDPDTIPQFGLVAQRSIPS